VGKLLIYKQSSEIAREVDQQLGADLKISLGPARVDSAWMD